MWEKQALVALDRYGVGAIVDTLDESASAARIGSGEDRIIGVSQGWKLTGAMKDGERELADR